MSKQNIATFEVRTLELREKEGSAGTISGIACPFDVLTVPGALWGFREKFQPGAFRGSIASNEHDIKAYWMHEKTLILGSVRAKTLRLEEKSEGLHFEIDLPDNDNGRNAAVSVGRGDVTQVSFAFLAKKQEWDETDPKNVIRTVTEADIYEVSPEAFGAYGDATNVGTRAIETDYNEYKSVRDKDKSESEIKVNQAILDLRKQQITIHERS